MWWNWFLCGLHPCRRVSKINLCSLQQSTDCWLVQAVHTTSAHTSWLRVCISLTLSITATHEANLSWFKKKPCVGTYTGNHWDQDVTRLLSPDPSHSCFHRNWSELQHINKRFICITKCVGRVLIKIKVEDKDGKMHTARWASTCKKQEYKVCRENCALEQIDPCSCEKKSEVYWNKKITSQIKPSYLLTAHLRAH